MSLRTCVVGIGQKFAGDDGVGLAVLDELERRPVPEGTRLVRLADPMDLVSLFGSEERVVLVDAVLASPAGVVVELSLGELSRGAAHLASSHGLGAAQAIELARSLSPKGATPSIRVVAVTITRPKHYRVGLSPELVAAVLEAADRVVELLGN